MKNKSSNTFSIIFACFNEEEELEKTIIYTQKVLATIFKSFEIIIVNDASVDTSGKIADKLADKYVSVKVVHNPINLGQGISFLIGITHATGDLVMQNGVDRPFDVKDIQKILPLFNKCDIVAVVRKDRSAYNLWRTITSQGNNFFRFIFFGSVAQDLNFVQIYKRSVLQNIQVQSRSAAFVTQELVIKAIREGYVFKEITLPYYKRTTGEAHHGKKRDILWALIDLVNFWIDIHFKK